MAGAPEVEGPAESLTQAEREPFCETANEFIDGTNRAVGAEPVDGIAAAFVYACARFNLYCIQCLGHPPSELAKNHVEDFRKTYVAQANYNLQETLVAPRA